MFTVTYCNKKKALPNKKGTNSPVAKSCHFDSVDITVKTIEDHFEEATFCKLTARTDLNMKVQKVSIEAERQNALDRFVALNESNINELRCAQQEVLMAKMLITEAIAFQKRNGSALLEHTLRPDIKVADLKPGCQISTIKLLLSDVETIMKNPKHTHGYSAAKNSLSRVPLWALPSRKTLV